MLKLVRTAELLKAGKLLFHLRVHRLELDFSIRQPAYAALGENVDGEIDGNRARMKEIKRPEIHGAAGQVNPAGCMRNYRSGWWQALFRKEPRHFAELVITAVEKFLHRLLFQRVKVLEQ